MRFKRALLLFLSLGILLIGCGSEPKPTQKVSKPVPPPASQEATPIPPLATTNAATGTPLQGIIRAHQKANEVVGTSNLGDIQKAIETFQAEEGRNPTSLEELVQKGVLKFMPNAGAGHKFQYDPQTASVQIIPE